MWLSSLCGQGYVGMIPGMATTKTHATSQKARKKKPRSVRHTRAIQRERSKRPTMAPSAPEIEARLTELIHPAPYAQVAAVHAMRLRQRILNLPVMLAFVLSLIWRHLGSVTEAVRVLREEGLLWTQPTTVSGLAPALGPSVERLARNAQLATELGDDAIVAGMRDHVADDLGALS